ncbi:hypothetical protein FQ087_21050 [Sporosarcina sp. ANT_H38]|uniref:hypothetical protein n=1 Tax=Sporosarcina sp. ANT_H38 TaxID=2597358 RepID=UPI0011F24A60|nr:hypothetical protein [Sporosarcina sp. ANT_H38]KAA0941643.1 hypothetical protein FQ087_21050 [Sporosarcina sp. ANT_H38]
MKMSKVIMPLAVGTAILGYVIKKGEFPVRLSRTVSDIAQVASDATIEKSFGGLKLSEINEIVSNTYRGVKAVIDGDTLEYYFKSASGKQTPTARIELDSAGELVFTFRSYINANSPRFFIENLRGAMNKVN